MKGFGASASRAAIVLFVAVLAAPTGAYASVVYDLTLTATSDSTGTPLSTYNGTGTITLSFAPSATGETSYTSAAVTFLIDGVQFSGNASDVQFLNGNFFNATFSDAVGTSPSRFDLQTSGVYAFFYDDETQVADGSITSTLDPPAPTPLPAALPLFAGGLGAMGLLGWHRKRKAPAA
jgi:hypothetical protein